jgi:hypothetical protein
VKVVGTIATIEWRFRFRGALVHKHCEFFLMESQAGVPRPQLEEGITACRWASAAEALELIAYENARGVLRLAEALAEARRPAARVP